jgi:alkylation response protein AidB-like acyl-CoA dehydrogenase
MDLTFSDSEEKFRLLVREWIASSMPEGIKKKAGNFDQFGHDEVMQWHRILAEQGWAAPHWPAEFGGPDLDVTRRFILTDELERAGAPALSPFGLVMVGPLIQRFGSDEQKARFLPKILAGEEVWCQGYSEPNAGSDLAAVRTVAKDCGDHFLVTGQKTWTTYAQYADWIFCLVRTDPDAKKQAGISFLLIDIRTEGVEVKPMLTLGHTPAFCETFFDNVKVPKENLVGPLNGGWTLAKALLGHERTLVAAVGSCARTIELARRIATETTDGQSPLIENPVWRAKLMRLEARLAAHEMTNYRALAEQQKGRHPGPESSILKLVGSELQQRADELCLEAMGINGLSWFSENEVVPANQRAVGSRFCYNRATTIYAGSNEIQKNIIAKLILELPKK